jgi:hypothetical protein
LNKLHKKLQYDLHRHALMCVAPGQIGGKADTGEEIHTKGRKPGFRLSAALHPHLQEAFWGNAFRVYQQV